MERTEAHHAPNGGLCGSPALLLHWAVADQGKSDDRRWSRAQSPRPGWLAEGLRRGCAVDIARGQSRGPNVEMPDSGGRWLILIAGSCYSVFPHHICSMPRVLGDREKKQARIDLFFCCIFHVHGLGRFTGHPAYPVDPPLSLRWPFLPTSG